MSLLVQVVINSMQIPADGLSVAEARAKAVQQINAEPAPSTLEKTENGDETVITQPTQGA